MSFKDTSVFFGIFILIVAILLQTFPKSLLALDYQLNTDIFAAYCVNKDKPKMHCNGHCQFNKIMKDLDQHQGDSQTQEKTIISVYVVPQMMAVKITPETSKENTSSTFYSEDIIPKKISSKIFHPPQLLFS